MLPPFHVHLRGYPNDIPYPPFLAPFRRLSKVDYLSLDASFLSFLRA
jgi:hypothetical protein